MELLHKFCFRRFQQNFFVLFGGQFLRFLASSGRKFALVSITENHFDLSAPVLATDAFIQQVSVSFLGGGGSVPV